MCFLPPPDGREFTGEARLCCYWDSKQLTMVPVVLQHLLFATHWLQKFVVHNMPDYWNRRIHLSHSISPATIHLAQCFILRLRRSLDNTANHTDRNVWILCHFQLKIEHFHNSAFRHWKLKHSSQVTWKDSILHIRSKTHCSSK